MQGLGKRIVLWEWEWQIFYTKKYRMSLQTVIQLGNIIRKSDKALAYHRYVRKAPQGDKKRVFKYFQLDVNEKMEIDFGSLKAIDDEDFTKEKLFYLAYRTGEADTYVKYIFGDFCSDYFKLADASKKASSLYAQHSFDRGKLNAEAMNSPTIDSFRTSLGSILDELLEFLQPHPFWHVNFNFQGKNWYELTDIYEHLNEALLNNFIKKENGKITLSAFLVRTLITATARLPDFNPSNTYKTKHFNNIEEVKDLLFGLDFYLKGYKIREDDIMINMLPKGNISAGDIITFFDKKKNVEFKNEEEIDETDPFLVPALDHKIASIEKYDIIFSKESKPIGLDLLEINDVDKNLLKKVQEKITATKIAMDQQGFNIKFLGIKNSLKSLFDGKKYKNHLLKVLPKIYQDTYHQDALLLPIFLQKAAYLTRNPDKSYKKFKDGKFPYQNIRKHFFFLIQLQNNNNLMAITDSKSFQIGNLLGTMAEPFAAWRDTCPIKSFEKSYVGNLSRRISNIDSLIHFANFLNEKLTIHSKTFPSIKKAYLDLVKIIGELGDEKYNKDYCQLGFFESYYGTLKVQESQDDTSEDK